jgi:hypothetical protein
MARRFRPAYLIALALVLAPAACTVPVSNDIEPAAVTVAGSPEEQLSLQARAMQRTVLEGAIIGAGLGAAASTRVKATPIPFGVAVGVAGGLAGGNYVGFLQSQFANNEDRLEQLRRDIDATNAETEATIRTMREVLARQQGQLATARAAGGGQETPALEAQQAQARTSLADMQLAISGATNREAEFDDVRALTLVPGQRTGVDGQVAELGSRIAEMRQIANSLAADL